MEPDDIRLGSIPEHPIGYQDSAPDSGARRKPKRPKPAQDDSYEPAAASDSDQPLEDRYEPSKPDGDATE